MNKFKNYINKKEQLIAVRQYGYNIQFIDNPDEEIQLIAVKKSRYTIEYIKNLDKETILYILKKDINNFKYVNNISIETQEYLIKNMPELLLEYPDKFDKSLKKKYKHLLIPNKLGIFDNE